MGKGTTNKEHKFALEYVKNMATDHMDKAEATTAAYVEAYHPTTTKTKSIKDMAYQVLNRPAVRNLIDQLQQGVRYQFILMAPAAQERLEDLAIHAASEKVKLEANLQILDRAGFKPPEKVELATVGIFGSASADEIRNILRQNLASIETEAQGEKN